MVDVYDTMYIYITQRRVGLCFNGWWVAVHVCVSVCVRICIFMHACILYCDLYIYIRGRRDGSVYVCGVGDVCTTCIYIF